MADATDLAAVRTSYDRVAAEYAARLGGELASKPLDRALLTAFAEQTPALGPIADIGCGPGQVARYLHDLGAVVEGIDLSPVMVAEARRFHPEIAFREGSLLDLPVEDATLGGIVAFYSLIHLTAAEVPRAVAEFARVLRPGGLVLAAFHLGHETVHLDEWWEQPVSLDFRYFAMDEMSGWFDGVGFVVEVRLERTPYAPHEYPSMRGYVLGRKVSVAHPAMEEKRG